ncbi:MAG: hypothetical protein DRR11_19605 [Gammaproteobacteria bacterium]|nr:MAG: hypothetical protein DRR11_19605 [Gammaproteobacteria bacterium]
MMKNNVKILAGLLSLIFVPSIVMAAFTVQTNSNVTSASNVTSTSVVTGGASGELYIDADHWSQSCVNGSVLVQDNINKSGGLIFPISSLGAAHGHIESEDWNWYVVADHQWFVCHPISGGSIDSGAQTSANGNDCS